MKKYTTTIALLLTLGVFAFLTHSTSEAQEAPQIELSGIEKLAEAINRAVDAFAPQVENNFSEGMTLEGGMATESVPKCSDEAIKELPWSSKRKENPQWDLNIMRAGSQNGSTDTWLDVNGDGMIDYMYHYARAVGSSSFTLIGDGGEYDSMYTGTSCVALNNGSGWDYVYRCLAMYDYDDDPSTNYTFVIKYYGDCADLS